MTVVCGLDFSRSSLEAACVAAALAARNRLALHLVHCVDALVGNDETAIAAAKIELEKAARLIDAGGEIHAHAVTGSPDDALLRVAEETQASLLVVGSVGHGAAGSGLGSKADRLSQRSRIPVLVVRDPERLMAWSTGKRPLRVLVSANSTATSRAAAHWAADLSHLGETELTLTHLYFPPDEYARLGLTGPRSYVDADPEVVAVLRRELAATLDLSEDSPRLRVEPHVGRTGHRLADIAKETESDLVVVGTHPRNALSRLWKGSVSQDVLTNTPVSVACIPTPSGRAVKKVERLENILVATDFSPSGDAAVALGYVLSAGGATVHLLHVIANRHPGGFKASDVLTRAAPENEAAHRAAEERLGSLSLNQPNFREHDTELHVIESNDTARAIAQAAERLNADVVCVGTRGYGILAGLVLGSVAQKVLAETRRQVLFARAEEA